MIPNKPSEWTRSLDLGQGSHGVHDYEGGRDLIIKLEKVLKFLFAGEGITIFALPEIFQLLGRGVGLGFDSWQVLIEARIPDLISTPFIQRD